MGRAAVYLLEAFALLVIAKWAYTGLYRRVDLKAELFDKGNVALAVSVAGYLFGITIALGGVLADEPTGNLDLKTGTEIIELLREMNETQGVTIISATHDHKMLSVSDRVVWIKDGQKDRVALREDLDIETVEVEGE